MGAYKDKGGRWYVSVRYKNWLGEPARKTKRGFTTKRDALAWEREFLQKSAGSLDMTFNSFYEVYRNDLQNRIRQNTWVTKGSIIEKKILPYFGDKRIRDVKPVDILHWQNIIMKTTDENGMPYSPVYLKTIHNQLSAMFNHAVRFYGLPENPAAKAGNMGKEKCGEVLVWTKDEYLQFIEMLKDKPASYYAFETLYWCGLRLGEMLALIPADFDFERKIIHVTKSFQRIKGEDIITPPKTEKGIRRVLMPDFYADKMWAYIKSLQLNENDRVFPFTKSYLHHEMRRGCAASGVKRIRIHGIRHSHISLLIDMGFSDVAIADRVGHESIDITYRYAHVFPSTQQEVADKLGELFVNYAEYIEK